MFLFGLIIGLIIGGICIYLFLKPSLEQTEKINTSIIQDNELLEEKNTSLREENYNLSKDNAKLDNENSSLRQQQVALTENIYILEEQAKNASEIFYKQSMETMTLKLEQSAEKEREKFIQAQESYQNEYLQVLNDCITDYNNSIQEKRILMEDLEKKLHELRISVGAAIEANKRAYAIEMENQFYRLQLSEQDLNEIEKLREIIPYLRDPESLNKVIWKIYYEKPYTDLVGRVIGSNVKTGIYKITNVNNQMCYVGQAVNIAERWRQHIKRGMGAETPTKNKLYPAMLQEGVQNFTFEIIEECDRTLLNDREDYWQDYFKAKEFGYSIK